MEHVSDHDLERYHLGAVVNEAELVPFEEHLLACSECVERAEQAAEYVDLLRASILANSELLCFHWVLAARAKHSRPYFFWKYPQIGWADIVSRLLLPRRR
jgi:hypothetical protein